MGRVSGTQQYEAPMSESVLKRVLGEDPGQVPGVFLFELDYTPFSDGFKQIGRAHV